MKKTILFAAAIALCPVASAQGVEFTLQPASNATLAEDGTLAQGKAIITWDTAVFGTSLTDYAITFTVNLIKVNDGYTNHVLVTAPSPGTNLKVRFCDGNANEPQEIVLGSGDAATYEQTSVVFTSGGTYTLAVLDNKAYLWEGDSISENFAESMADRALDLTDINATLTSGVSYAYAPFSNNLQLSIKLESLTKLDNGADAIPEPATATLSLLALAGLAARRRRQ